MAHLSALPRWQWDQTYHAPEVLEHGVKGAVERSVAAGGDLQTITRAVAPHVPHSITLQTIDSQWS